MHKPNLKRASRFAEIARKTGGVFVFATRDATLPNAKDVSAEIAKHSFVQCSCKKCTAEFAFPKAEGAQPFCVVCGDGNVEVKGEVKASIAPDEELSYLTCAGCGTINAFHAALAGVGKHIHCSACGTDMLEKAADGSDEGDGEDIDFDEDTEEAADDAPEVDDMELLDLEDDIEDTDDAVATTTNEDQVGVKPNTTTLPDDAGADRGPGAPDSALVDGKPDNPGIEPTTQNPDAVEPKVTKADTVKADADEMPENDYGDETMDMDLVDVEDEDETPIESVSFFYGDKKVLLSARDQIIATLAEADAGAYKDMLQTEQFRMSVAHTIETEGLKKALATYKFKPSKVTVKVSKVVQAKVDAATEKQRKTATAGADTYAEQFQHSLDIAAAGYAGNFWRNKHDPLKTALIAELASLNIRKPEKIIDKIFAQYSVAQFREVIDVARELAKKPVVALNALAETIDLVKYTPTANLKKPVTAGDDADEDESVDDDDVDDDETEDEGEEFATATPVEVVTSSLKDSSFKTPELRRILGNSSSFF